MKYNQNRFSVIFKYTSLGVSGHTMILPLHNQGRTLFVIIKGYLILFIPFLKVLFWMILLGNLIYSVKL